MQRSVRTAAGAMIVAIVCACAIMAAMAGATNLYAVLGIARTASTREIKRAYRRKAKDFHPDKHPDATEADKAKFQERFTEVVTAFETLSDDRARRIYDQTGRTPSQQEVARQEQQRQWQRQQRRFFMPRHVRWAQQMVMNIRSRAHLDAVALEDEPTRADGRRGLDRYMLLAFYERGTECEDALNYDVQYPSPFAHSSSDFGTWWDEILLAGKVDMKTASGLVGYYGIETSRNCPTIVMFERGGTLENDRWRARTSPSAHREEPLAYLRGVRSHQQFEDWVWQQLKVEIAFRNDHDHPVALWWISGLRAVERGTIAVNATYNAVTHLSHIFLARDARVQSSRMSNGSSLLWHMVRPADDGQVVPIRSRCFDLDGNCRRWAREGLCTAYKRFPEIPAKCFVSCGYGCGGAGYEGGVDGAVGATLPPPLGHVWTPARGGPSHAAWLGTHVGTATASAEAHWEAAGARALGFRERLERFYGRYNAAKTPADIAQMVAKYAGREKSLFRVLVKKYGPEPSGGPVGAGGSGYAVSAYAWPPRALGGPGAHCEFWAGLTAEGRRRGQDECHTRPDWAWEQCPSQCAVAAALKLLRVQDYKSECAFWAGTSTEGKRRRQNECVNRPAFMEEHCAYSCAVVSRDARVDAFIRGARAAEQRQEPHAVGADMSFGVGGKRRDEL